MLHYKPFFHQCAIHFALFLVQVLGGCAVVQSSFSSFTFILTPWISAAVISFVMLGGFFGSVSTCFLVACLGYRWSLVLASVLATIGEAIFSLVEQHGSESAASPILLLVSQLLTGFGCGIWVPVASLLSIQSTSAHRRDSVTLMPAVRFVLGVTLVFVLSVWLDTITLSQVLVALTFSSVIFFLLLDNIDQIVPIGLTYETKEVAQVATLEAAVNQVDCKRAAGYFRARVYSIFHVRRRERPLLLFASALMTIQQLMGVNLLNAYSQSICMDTLWHSFNECSVHLAMVQLSFILLAAYCVRQLDLKAWLLHTGFTISGLYMFISFCHTVQFMEKGVCSHIVMDLCIKMVACLFAVSWLPVPFYITVNLFPQEQLLIPISVSLSAGWFVSYILSQFFRPLCTAGGYCLVFGLLSLSCFVASWLLSRYPFPLLTTDQHLEKTTFPHQEISCAI